MTADIASIRARITAATPGPWKAEWVDDDQWWQITGQPFDDDGQWLVCPEVATSDEPDGTEADLIAHAPVDLAALCDEVEALRQTLLQRTAERDFHITEVDELSAKLEHLAGQWMHTLDRAVEGGRRLGREELDDNCRALGHALTQEIRRRDQAEAELELLREELARTRTVASDE